MEKNERIKAFTQLGLKIANLKEEEIASLTIRAQQGNGWFTRESIENALSGITFMLEEEKVKHWLSKYNSDTDVPKIVGIVMAGNIPMVGFHDLLAVLISGHVAVIKPSSDDEFLTRTLIDWLLEIEPRLKKSVDIREKLTGVDAVIATGSDNTARYFEYYFRDIPHIIRKNRTSIAILDGKETENQLNELGKDIFSYFGLGCRNVSKVFTPEGYDLREVFPHFNSYEHVIHHHKYRNNYDYYKSIYLVNKTPHLDTGFLLVNSTNELFSPVSVLYHQAY
ncbi:MAG: acyl-CoA reductase, partial [Bacteroidota bacterium]